MAVRNVYMQIEQVSQNIPDNYSMVRVRGFATMTGQSQNNYTLTGNYVLDGQSYSFETTLPANTTKTLFDAQHPVYHNADGTKTVTGSFSLATGISAGTIRANAELILTNIPRTTPCPDLNGFIGQTLYSTVNSASSSFTHKLCFVVNGEEIVLQDNIVNTIEFIVPTSLYDFILNSNEISGELRLYTYSNGTVIGVDNGFATFLINFDETNVPVITDFSIIDIYKKTIDLTGNPEIIINNHSTVQTTINAYAQANATLQNYGLGYKINDSKYAIYGGFENNTFSISNFSIPYDVEKPIVLAYVQDSRLKHVVKELDITENFINYFNIVLLDPENVVSFKRPQIFSEKMQMKFQGEYWKGNFGVEENSFLVKWRVKPNKESFSEWQILTPNVDYLDKEAFMPNFQAFSTGDIEPKIDEDGNEYYDHYPIEIKNPFTEDGNWDYLTTYTFEIIFEDKLTKLEYTRIVYPSNPILSWYEDGEKANHVEVHGKLEVDNDIETNGGVISKNGYMFKRGDHSNYAIIGSNSTWRPNPLLDGIKCLGINCNLNTEDDGEFGLVYKDTRAYPFTDGWFYQNLGEYRCLDTSMCNLLWWNYDQTTFDEGYLGIDVSNFDFVLVITSAGSNVIKVGAFYLSMNFFDIIWDANGGGDRVCKRSCWVGYVDNRTDIYVGACSGWGINSYTGFESQNAVIIPMAVYGIKVW